MTETIPDDQPDEQPRVEDRPDTTESGQSSPENHGESPSPGDDGSSDESIGLPDARRTAIDAAEDLLEHEFEGVIKIEATDTDGWRALVEVLEREAVPDTQDILGRYEITMDSTGQVDGYGLLERYRRGELKEEL